MKVSFKSIIIYNQFYGEGNNYGGWEVDGIGLQQWIMAGSFKSGFELSNSAVKLLIYLLVNPVRTKRMCFI
jgi:hypothetical protein